MPESRTLVSRIPPLRIVAWELTRACNLACRYCRARASPHPAPNELTTGEATRLLDEVAFLGVPMVILTGGEPLLRKEALDIARYASSKVPRVVLGTNGSLIDEPMARRIADCGIKRISISLDGATPEAHDGQRGAPGAFSMALRGIGAARKAGLPFQINTTVSRANRGGIRDIAELTARLGAVAWHPFLLVPTGRAESLSAEELSAQEYDQTLGWLVELKGKLAIPIKVTCAPHFQRVLLQRGLKPDDREERRRADAELGGCLGGQSFCFVAADGDVQPCGYLPVVAGNVRRQRLRSIWGRSKLFRELRAREGYKGKCGVCSYVRVCGGCRARAFAVYGDYLAEEPLCAYSPPR